MLDFKQNSTADLSAVIPGGSCAFNSSSEVGRNSQSSVTMLITSTDCGAAPLSQNSDERLFFNSVASAFAASSDIGRAKRTVLGNSPLGRRSASLEKYLVSATHCW